MRKALLAVVALVVIVVGGWFAVRAYATTREHRAAAVVWPAHLGSLAEVPKRFPDTEQSEGATKLIALANAAHVDLAPRVRSQTPETKRDPMQATRKAIGEYVQAQLERSGDAIDAPPPAVAQYLAENAAALDAIRDHVLSGAPIVWESKLSKGWDAPIPNLAGHMTLQKIFAARALDKARSKDASAWEDLRASWRWNRGLWSRPDLISLLIALASSRMTNAAACKMPLPAPAWLGETFTFDYAGPMAAAQQADAWIIHRGAERSLPWREKLREAEYRRQSAEYLDVMRTYTDEALKSKACDAASPEFATARASLSASKELAAIPNLVAVWQRLIRFRAELEATERVLQLRAGQMLTVNSRCSDGTWQLTPNGMKFSRAINVTAPQLNVPLAYTR
jgi:hypothetical protein